MAIHDSEHQRAASEKAAADARKAEDARRKAAGEAAKAGTEAARKTSEETLREQSSMKPYPSQEHADKIVAGAIDPVDNPPTEKTEGPAQRAADGRPDAVFRTSEATGEAAGYQTRQASATKPVEKK